MARDWKGGPDWDALKRQWLASDESLNEFKDRHGIRNGRFYKKVKEFKWREEKKAIQDRVVKRVADKLVDKGYDEWEREQKLLGAIQSQVAFILKKHVNEEGRIITAIPPSELRALMLTVEASIRSKRHMKGEAPGDGMGDNGGGSVHFHQTLVNVVTQVEKDGSGTLLEPPTLKKILDIKPEEKK